MISHGSAGFNLMVRLRSSGRALAWATPVFAEAAALGRSIAFAWTLGPDELGKAMMLALTVRLVEMASDLGVDRLLVQAPDGNSATLQSRLQGVLIARGVLTSLLIVAIAPVLAGSFADGPNTASYALLAFVPLVRGFVHLDYRRAERQRRYAKMAMVEAGATLAMTVCVLPAAWLTNDHRAMSLVLVTHAVAYTVLSHFVAHRRYRLCFDADTMVRSWRFGAPLLLNAILLFFTFYADRLIVAGAYDWATLALYGVALQLALIPAQIVGRAAASLVLPRLRQAFRDNCLAEVWQPIASFHLMLACAMVAGFAALAPSVIGVIYGAEFKPSGVLALALGCAAGFRILRTPYSQLAIASGRTGDPARANLFRAFALLPAGVFAFLGGPLTAIAAAAALGEAGAMLRAIQLAKTHTQRLDLQEAMV
ncbi:MAG: oligosaccharide flippase family protein [Tateyamaria sp.]